MLLEKKPFGKNNAYRFQVTEKGVALDMSRTKTIVYCRFVIYSRKNPDKEIGMLRINNNAMTELEKNIVGILKQEAILRGKTLKKGKANIESGQAVDHCWYEAIVG